MKKRALRGMMLGLLIAVGLAGCSVLQPEENSETGAPAATQATQNLENVIWASGKLVPKRWAYLGFPIPGRLASVTVAEGDVVRSGQALAALDAVHLQAGVAQAEAQLAAAQAQLAAVKAPARAEELAAAEGALQSASARVEAAKAAANTAQSNVSTAQAQVAIAEATQRRVRAGARAEEVAAARERLDLAQAQRDQAQAAYDSVAGDPHIGMRPEAVALQQATASYRAAKATYDAIASGPTAEDLAVGQSQIDAAKAAVGVAETGVTSAEVGITTAETEVMQARARLDLLKAGARLEDVAIAEAAVAQALAALDSAKTSLAQAQLVAPFDGTVGALWHRAGEIVQAGQDVATLGDLGAMHIETTDLRETDVARLQIGQPVEVTFDALPNRVFRGTIAHLAPMATTDKGSVNYTVTIDLDKLDPAMRWGMTAFVNIAVE